MLIQTGSWLKHGQRMMSDNTPPEGDDLWLKVTRTVRKTSSNRYNVNSYAALGQTGKKTAKPKARKPAPPQPTRDTKNNSSASTGRLSAHSQQTPSHQIADLTQGQYAGIDRLSARRLHSGRLAIDSQIDLHGLSQNQAHTQLTRFLLSASARGDRTVLVITGKGKAGQGVLRSQLPVWLKQPPLDRLIIAIDHAVQRDGGAGAYYIRLKRKRGQL